MKKRLSDIYKRIKEVKIQGASNIARAALEAYYLKPNNENKRKLLSLRPTEPMLSNVLHLADKIPKNEILAHFNDAQSKINKNVLKLIKNGMIIYTHCHSTNVVKALIYVKNKGKKFEVYNTETRPLYQGRTTARELAKKGINVTDWVDSAMDEAIEKSDIVLLGSDAILNSGIINKIGSDAIAKLAYVNKKPVYIIADSWKFSPKSVKIEERDFHEVWKKAGKHIKVMNPAFEKVEKKYIKGLVSELGILKFDVFLKKVERKK